MKTEIIELLIKEASKARMNAYAPYSGYLVGAAVIVPSGNIFTGCNIENASYGLSNCAERTAIFKAVSEGQRHIDGIAIIGGPIEEVTDLAYPCGACRQVISEFSHEDTIIIVAKNEDEYEVYKASELLPHTFKLDK